MDEIRQNRYSSACFWLFAVAALLFEVTGQSFCADEAARLYDLTFSTLWNTLSSGLKDGQFLYLLAAYTWRMFFGHTEWVMRALNVPFAVVMLAYLRACLRQSGRSPWYAILLICQPVFAQYVNQAGPFVMVGAAAAAFTYYALYSSRPDEARTIVLVNVFFLVGVLSYGVFVFFYAVYITNLVLRRRHHQLDDAALKRHLLGMGAFLPVWILAAAMLVWGVANSVSVGGSLPEVFNLGEMIYCFLGLAGIGLSREELLERKFSLLTRQNILLIGMVLLAIAVIAAALIRRRRVRQLFSRRKNLYLGALVYLALFWVVSSFSHFMLYEQHVFPLLVVLVLFYADLIDILQISLAHRALQGAVILLVAMQMYSSFQLRSATRYLQDDYRTVAQTVMATQNLNRTTLFTSGFDRAWRFYGIAPEDGSGDVVPEGSLRSVDINGISVEELDVLIDQIDGPVILVLNEEDVPAETYAWNGHGNCREQRVNDMRILWVNS